MLKLGLEPVIYSIYMRLLTRAQDANVATDQRL